MTVATTDDDLTFDADSHTYYLDGSPLPNVTSVVRSGLDTEPGFAMVPDDVLEKARQRGIAVHDQIDLFHRGETPLVAEHLPEDVQDRLRGYREFLDVSGYDVVASEQRRCCRCHRVAGTYDSRGFLYGNRTIIDVKVTTSLNREYVNLQLAAYRHFVRLATGHDHDVYALQLPGDGRYKLVPLEDPDAAFLRFVEALSTFDGEGES